MLSWGQIKQKTAIREKLEKRDSLDKISLEINFLTQISNTNFIYTVLLIFIVSSSQQSDQSIYYLIANTPRPGERWHAKFALKNESKQIQFQNILLTKITVNKACAYYLIISVSWINWQTAFEFQGTLSAKSLKHVIKSNQILDFNKTVWVYGKRFEL